MHNSIVRGCFIFYFTIGILNAFGVFYRKAIIFEYIYWAGDNRCNVINYSSISLMYKNKNQYKSMQKHGRKMSFAIRMRFLLLRNTSNQTIA